MSQIIKLECVAKCGIVSGLKFEVPRTSEDISKIVDRIKCSKCGSKMKLNVSMGKSVK